MKRFKFQFDAVLRYRRYLEQMALMELAGVKKKMMEVKENIFKMERKRNVAVIEMMEQESNGTEVKRHRIFETYIQGIESNIKKSKNRVLEIEKEIVEKRKLVEIQRIKKETYETIKCDAKKRHVEASLRAEQKEADDLANLRLKFKDWKMC